MGFGDSGSSVLFEGGGVAADWTRETLQGPKSFNFKDMHNTLNLLEFNRSTHHHFTYYIILH